MNARTLGILFGIVALGIAFTGGAAADGPITADAPITQDAPITNLEAGVFDGGRWCDDCAYSIDVSSQDYWCEDCVEELEATPFGDSRWCDDCY